MASCSTTRAGVLADTVAELREFVRNNAIDDPILGLQYLRNKLVLDRKVSEDLIQLLDEAAVKAFPGEVSDAYINEQIDIADLNAARKETKIYDTSSLVSDLNRLDSFGAEASTDAGEGINLGNNSSGVIQGDGGSKAYDGNWFELLGRVMSDSELAKVYNKVREISFEAFTTHAYRAYGVETFSRAEAQEAIDEGHIDSYKIYDVLVDMFEYRASTSKDGDYTDIWVADSEQDIFAQYDNMRTNAEKRGERFNYAPPVVVDGQPGAWVIKDLREERGDDKMAFVDGSASHRKISNKLSPDPNNRIKGQVYYNDTPFTQKRINELMVARRKLRVFWLVNQAANKMKFRDRIQLTWTNISQRKFQALMRKANGALDFVKEQLPTALTDSASIREFGQVPMFNLKTMIDSPEWINTNFIDFLKTKVGEFFVGDVTKYIALSDLVDIHTARGGAGWYAKDYTESMTESMLMDWAKQLMNYGEGGSIRPQVIVGMSAGDKGNILVTQVQAEHINQILTHADIVAAVNSEELNLSAELKAEFAAYKGSPYVYMKAIQKRITDGDLAKWVNKENIPTIEGGVTSDTRGNAARAAEYVKLIEAVNKAAFAGYQVYFQMEMDAGNITSEHWEEFKNSLKPENLPKDFSGKGGYPIWMHMGGIIAKHDWWKAVRGNYYLMKTTLHNFNRARLSVTKGLIDPEASDTRHVIYDQEKVDIYYNGERIDNIQSIPGLVSPKNIFDGISFISSRLANSTADGFGSNPILENEHNLGEVKTVLVEMAENKNDYIEMKHSEQLALAGLKIVAKGKDPNELANLVAEVVNEDGDIKIFENRGGFMETVDMLTDLDSVKTSTGIYDITGKLGGTDAVSTSFTLSNLSRRVVISPHAESADNVYNATQYLNTLSYISDQHQDTIDAFATAFTEMLVQQSSMYHDTLVGAVSDPQQMRDLVGYIFSNKNVQKELVANKLNATGGKGVNSAEFRNLFESLLMNQVYIKGATQARTLSPKFKEGAQGLTGSHYVLKPDPGRIGLDENGVPEGIIMSASNHGVFNKIVNSFRDNNLLTDDFNNLSSEQKTQEINALLNKHEVSVMTYRSPIIHINGVESRRVLEFTHDDGNAIYHHPIDVFTRLVGDFDIDEAGVVILPRAMADAFKKFQNSQFFKEKRRESSELDFFKKPDPHSLASFSGTFKDMATTIKGHHAQGIMTNAKNLLFTLPKHFNTIEFTDKNGTVIRLTPKKADDEVVMDYAEVADKVERLDDHGNKVMVPFTETILHDMGWTWASIVVKDGKRYLKTTAQHEMLLIVNAAVDHPKLNILTGQWGFEDSSWIHDRLFVVETAQKTLQTNPDGSTAWVEGEDMTWTPGEMMKTHHMQLKGYSKKGGGYVAGILDNFKFSQLKKGRDGIGRKMNMDQYFYKLTQLHTFFNMSASQQEAFIQGKNEGLKVSMNKHMTHEEKLLLNTISKHLELDDGRPHPFYFSETLDNVVHLKAARATAKEMSTRYGVSAEGAQAAHVFAVELMNDYWAIIEKSGGKFTQKTVNYDPDMLALMLTAEAALKGHVKTYGEGFSAVATSIMLNRVEIMDSASDNKHSAMNIKQLPPLPSLHTPTYVMYKEYGEFYQYEKDSDGNAVNDSMEIFAQEIRNRQDVEDMFTRQDGTC